MYNKPAVRSSYMKRRANQHSNFQLDLTQQQELSNTPLSYSVTAKSHKLIDVRMIPSKQQVFPDTTDFSTQQLTSQFTCKRKDCMDRKFRAIKTAQRSSFNSKLISPRKVDIVLDNNSDFSNAKRQPGIHSFKRLAHRSQVERDMLRQFRELQQARKELKSRKDQKGRPLSLSLNMIKGQGKECNNPEKSGVYLQVKNKISKRYNSMFRKYAQSFREQLKGKEQMLHQLCKATSIGSKVTKTNSRGLIK